MQIHDLGGPKHVAEMTGRHGTSLLWLSFLRVCAGQWYQDSGIKRVSV